MQRWVGVSDVEAGLGEEKGLDHAVCALEVGSLSVVEDLVSNAVFFAEGGLVAEAKVGVSFDLVEEILVEPVEIKLQRLVVFTGGGEDILDGHGRGIEAIHP